MKIGIIDDERPARGELRLQLEDMEEYDMEILEGSSGEEAIRIVADMEPDLLFLDISLGDMNGTALVPALQKMQPNMMICFVTAYSDYAVQAFNLDVDDYVLKPFEGERIQRVVRKCMNRLSSAAKSEDQDSTEHSAAKSSLNSAVDTRPKQPRRIAVVCADRRVYIETADLVYVETYQRGCRIYTKNQVFETHRPIGEYEKKLPEFVRIQRSYLVNVDRIQEIFSWSKNSVAVRMEYYPDQILTVSRDMVKTLKSRLEG